ncbi:MAG: thioredoxin [Candidatus Nanoarchaeia archaeon]|nr:thioredoxin [Candidatus Nanoarchaeia archaeon]MDD5054476.1 thioredoxin [Candidatus Nanoarchaeia archaeon]MDD5499618.1 thioredoxin [Candidatus Nanoarchaeia archaeon]
MEITVTDQNFKEEVLEKSKKIPVLVDFWATWCPPCNMLSPIIEEIAKEMDKKLVVAKADTENCHKTASEYGVMSIPSLKIFKNGKIIAQMMGYVPKSALVDWINESI